jgi:endo-1,4-beta-D-glucanase Y
MEKNKIPAIVSLISLIISLSFGQQYPFPQNYKFPYGYMPSTFKTSNLESWYAKYKTQSSLLIECNGGIRTGSEDVNTTKVESMGWAMIIAAYMGDKTTFDGLYKFYNSKKQSHGMMAWKVSCTGVLDGGSAADGDLDVTYSLVVASWQWGGTYKDEAVKMITTVKKLITTCSGTSVLMGGAGYGGCNETDLSYYTPAFFRAFAQLSGDAAWTKLADDTYTVLNNNANSSTGLVPDWSTWNGGASAGGRNHSYSYDACRVPWRMAIDYLWNGNEKAQAWCKKISDWAYKIGPKNIKAGYNLDGTTTSSYHNMSFVGGFAIAAMCNSQEIADAFGQEIASMGYDTYWYHAFLGTCYMLTMSGNIWNPDLKKNSQNNSFGKGRSPAASNGSITITNRANRELHVSGIGKANSVRLTTLNGRLVIQTSLIRNAGAFLDISSVDRGCYIISVRDKNVCLYSEVIPVH